jgi:hypothetical protein
MDDMIWEYPFGDPNEVDDEDLTIDILTVGY